MNRYKPIIIVGILVAFVTVGLAMYEQLTAATRDKKSECNTRYIELTHRIERVIGAKHDQMQSLSGRFRLSDDYQIKSDISSFINDGNQFRADCRDVIDFTQPPSGYSYEEWQNLQQSIHNTLIIMDNKEVGKD
jgi:hypothetical protein